ncbi:hypothetical protein B0H13DRAFT_1649978 [Mycena leptocephala]|nr:hypothetical protein B0H13DRAFT_1649978 [Mycena leptocephala]
MQTRTVLGLHILRSAAASDAFHDSAERYPQPKCHPETRTEMLEQLREWSYQTDPSSGVLWLHGPAGAGKSAIAQSFCQTLETEGRLGASFFFKRGHRTRGTANQLFSTIAYQLAICLPELNQAISQTVESNPSILNRTLSVQLQKLILDPCRQTVSTGRKVIIVIDGLDECEDPNIQQDILRSIYIPDFPFRFLIASRPEPHIHKIFANTLKDNLLSININQSFEDVEKYLLDEFARIRRDHGETMSTVPKPWPSPHVVEDLVQTSSGYFVYAATVVKFIDDPNFRPTERLDMITGLKPALDAPFAALDQLYIQILEAVPLSSRPQLLGILTVIVAKFNLSLLHIEQLLELNPGDVRLILRHLHSVLLVPVDNNSRIIVHHASFLDFLGDAMRSGSFYIDNVQEANVARHILKALAQTDDHPSHVAW